MIFYIGLFFLDMVLNKKSPETSASFSGLLKDGGDLLSHLIGSTIGAGGLNFSVRHGKRWSPTAVATLGPSSPAGRGRIGLT